MCLSDYFMGPLPEGPNAAKIRRVVGSILADCHELTEGQKRALEEFGEALRKEFESNPPRGLRGACFGLEMPELW